MKIIEQKFAHANFIKQRNNSFKGVEQAQIQTQLAQPPKPSGWEKAVKGFASFVIPGVGQFLDKRNKTGWLHLGLLLGLAIISGIVGKKIYKGSFDGKKFYIQESSQYYGVFNLLSFLSFGLKLGSCVDAVVNCGKQVSAKNNKD